MFAGNRIVSVPLGSSELRDSFAILPAPLKAFSKDEIQINKLEACCRHAFKDEIESYMLGDCWHLRRLVIRFCASNGIRKKTAASCAMESIKKLCPSVDTLSLAQDISLRKFFFGGLVWARESGLHYGDFALYDVTSMYPAVMRENHPISNDYKYVRGYSRNGDFFKIVGPFKAFLRREEKRNAIGGNGNFYISRQEFDWGNNNGYVTKEQVAYSVIFARRGNFSNFVDKHYATKEACEKSGDKAGREIAKIFLNSGYGKFAQKPESSVDRKFVALHSAISDEEFEDGWLFQCDISEYKLSVWQKPNKNPRLYNVATGASITGAARAKLWKAVFETNALYCDTDSILCRSKDLPGNIGNIGNIGNKLGEWKPEGNFDLVAIAGKKLYAFRSSTIFTEAEAKDAKLIWEDGRAWKIASKGVRLLPSQIVFLASHPIEKNPIKGKGIYVTHENIAPTFSLSNFGKFVKRDIRRTA